MQTPQPLPQRFWFSKSSPRSRNQCSHKHPPAPPPHIVGISSLVILGPYLEKHCFSPWALSSTGWHATKWASKGSGFILSDQDKSAFNLLNENVFWTPRLCLGLLLLDRLVQAHTPAFSGFKETLQPLPVFTLSTCPTSHLQLKVPGLHGNCCLACCAGLDETHFGLGWVCWKTYSWEIWKLIVKILNISIM